MTEIVTPEPPHPRFSLIGGNKILAGSMIGGIAETQEMLDFCAEHGIGAEIERITASEINEAYERVLVEKVPGFTISKDLPKLGYKGVESCEINFADCRVPPQPCLASRRARVSRR